MRNKTPFYVVFSFIAGIAVTKGFIKPQEHIAKQPSDSKNGLPAISALDPSKSSKLPPPVITNSSDWELRFLNLVETASLDELRGLAIQLQSRENRGFDTNTALRYLWTKWGTLDIGSAVRAATELRIDSKAYSYLLCGGASVNAKEAMQIFSSFGAKLQQSSVNGLLEGLAAPTSFHDLLAWVGDSKNTRWLNQSACSTIANTLFRNGTVQDLITLADKVPQGDGEQKQLLFSMGIDKIATHDAEAALDFLTKNIDKDYVSGITSQYAIPKLIQAMGGGALVERLADLPLDKQGLFVVVEKWAKIDPNQVGVWLNSHPNASNRNEVIASFARQIATKDPEAARIWAAQLTSTEQRSNTLIAIDALSKPVKQ